MISYFAAFDDTWGVRLKEFHFTAADLGDAMTIMSTESLPSEAGVLQIMPLARARELRLPNRAGKNIRKQP